MKRELRWVAFLLFGAACGSTQGNGEAAEEATIPDKVRAQLRDVGDIGPSTEPDPGAVSRDD